MDKYEELKNFILKDIFNAPVIDDFLAYGAGKFVLNGKILSDNEAMQIVSEAEKMKNTLLYPTLIRLLKEIGQKDIAKADTWEKAQFGKAGIYMAFKIEELIDKIIECGKLPIPKKK